MLRSSVLRRTLHGVLVAACAVVLLVVAGCPQSTDPAPSDDQPPPDEPVEPVENHPPVFSSVPVSTVRETHAYLCPLTATDSDGDALTFSVVGLPSWLSLDAEAQIHGTAPRVNSDIAYPLTARVTDGIATAEQSWTLTVADIYSFVGVARESSIQTAIDAIDADSTLVPVIEVAAGEFDEALEIDKPVIIRGAGSTSNGTVIRSSAPPSVAGGVYTFRPTVCIAASGSADYPLTLQNIRIEVDQGTSGGGQFAGVLFAPDMDISHISLSNVTMVGTRAVGTDEHGLTIGSLTSVGHLEILDCTFSDLAYGAIFYNRETPDPTRVQNLTVRDSLFENNGIKGFYAEKLSDARFTNVTVRDNGDLDRAPDWADLFIAGIDINLKYGSYANLTFTNLTVEDNGRGATYGAGLTIKARGTGNDPTYSATPAYLDNVLIEASSFADNESADIRFGEPGKNNTSPTNIRLHNVTADTPVNELDNVEIAVD